MAPYLVAAFCLAVALTAVLVFPEAVRGGIKRFHAWVFPLLPAGQHDYRPRARIRLALVLGAYLAAALLTMICMTPGAPGDNKIADTGVIEWIKIGAILLIGVFPLGLANFFDLDPSPVPHVIYAVSVVMCFVVRQRRTFLICFAVFGSVLFLNVAGCAKGISL